MTVMIIGAAEEAHAAFIYEKIRARGAQAFYMDTRRFPSRMRLSLRVGQADALGELTDGETRIPLADIQSVYWRYHLGLELPDVKEPFLLEMAHREIESTLGSLFRILPCRWVNSPEAVAMHAYKTYQLKLLHERNIRIPKTLVTNDPDAVIAFYEELRGQVIFKPVRGGAHTAKMSRDDLKSDRLKELSKAPVQFQELIEGVDVRAYLVDDDVFAGEIRSRDVDGKTLDFRADPDAEIVPVDLPEPVVSDCRTVAKTLNLLFTGIDIRRTPEGEHVFLEGNPAPMFMHFERRSGYPISDRLVNLLLKS